MSVSQSIIAQPATNFDLPSLHLLRPELEVSLQNAELHLSQFTDDTTHAPLLLDSQETLAQVSKVLGLISLTGADTLAQTLADGFAHLYAQRDAQGSDSEQLQALIMDLSEGIMTLSRYIEFVLLKQTVAPSLLLPVINLLQNSLGQPTSTLEMLSAKHNAPVIINNPQDNYHSLADLGINDQLLVNAYRAGLVVALKATAPITDSTDLQKIHAMSAACQAVNQRSQSLFWQAAAAATDDIVAALPLSLRQKRALIYVEQQFNNYLPIQDSRFADLVGFAATRNTVSSAPVQQKMQALSQDSALQAHMKHFLFGPNREVTDTLNQIIQDEIDQIKHLTDSYAREERATHDPEIINNISERLQNLSLVFKTLELPKASESLTQQVTVVKNWQQPTSEDFDSLLASLMVAENATISLAKSHTPGATVSLNNQNISLHQLDTAYSTLLIESRTSIATIEAAINDYLTDPNKDALHLANLPEMMQNVSGAAMFLKMPQSYQLLKRTSQYLTQHLQSGTPISDLQLTKIADIVMSVDYYLESLENNKPAGTQAIKVGQKSLQQLMAA